MKDDNQGNPKSSFKMPNSSIDIYAVQCVKCYKWRVIDMQEEYEEIRSKFTEEPYVCSKKPGISCNDPPDIDYDSSRTWVMDKPNLPKTPEGFNRSLVLRKDFSKLDAYYISSSGKKMRTLVEVAAFLEANPELKGVSVDDFSFQCPRVMEDTIPEYADKKIPTGGSASKKMKISKDGD
ncbi:hypothetical protein SAY87_025160 [Trapa incisa]|uniref:Uncharacterized protein n=2 Tax=Trapa TaxID=22665 RepID=A0AAN7LX36_TRANT|nr:hypothetical protein SAY87_025160 [Trapa incisa]KAK4787958.1 hypothetical protein SAY86_019277 [Trapa natans]